MIYVIIFVPFHVFWILTHCPRGKVKPVPLYQPLLKNEAVIGKLLPPIIKFPVLLFIICVIIPGQLSTGLLVNLNHTFTVNALPTLTLAKVQFVEPLSIIPLPALFLVMTPFAIVALFP